MLKLVRGKRGRRKEKKKEFCWRSCGRTKEGKRKKEIKGKFVSLLVHDINIRSLNIFLSFFYKKKQVISYFGSLKQVGCTIMSLSKLQIYLPNLQPRHHLKQLEANLEFMLQHNHDGTSKHFGSLIQQQLENH